MKFWVIGLAASSLALAACDRDNEPVPAPPGDADGPLEEQPVSIMRPDVEVEVAEPPLADLDARVPFGEGGDDLSDEALAELETIIASPQMRAGGEIVLRGHSDSAGDDEANMRASLRRAEAVRDHLVEQGVDEGRIRIVALGEHRPIAPNATLEGEPDEEGRALNRRVDVFIEAESQVDEAVTGTGTETLAETVSGE